jgi:hypothetical protein
LEHGPLGLRLLTGTDGRHGACRQDEEDQTGTIHGHQLTPIVIYFSRTGR